MSRKKSMFRRVRTSHLVFAYIVLIAFSSAAVPIGPIFVKFDWIGAALICVAGLLQIISGWPLNRVALTYVVIFIPWLIINGLTTALMAHGEYDLPGFLSYFLQFVLVLLTFLIISSIRFETEKLRRLMVVWVLTACTASLLSIVQILVGDIIIDNFLFIPYFDDGVISTKVVSGLLAPTAWFSEASWLAAFLVVPMMFALLESVSMSQLPERRTFYLISSLIIAIGLFLSYSLTGTVAVLIGILASIILKDRARLPIALLVAVGVGILLVYADSDRVMLQISRFTELFNSISDYSPGSTDYGTLTSFYVRSVGFSEGLSIFSQNPLIGIGIGQSSTHYHSGLITILAEQGIVGVLVYYFPVVWIILMLNRERISGSIETKHIATFLIVGLIADYTNGLVTHNSFHLQRWLLISLAFGWLLSVRRKRILNAARTNVRYGSPRMKLSVIGRNGDSE